MLATATATTKVKPVSTADAERMLFVLMSRSYVTAWLLRNRASVPTEWVTEVETGKFDHLGTGETAPDQEELEDRLEGLLKQHQEKQERAAARSKAVDDHDSNEDHSDAEATATMTQRQRQKHQREQELAQRKRAIAEAEAAKEAADRSREAVLTATRADRFAIETLGVTPAVKKALERGGWCVGSRTEPARLVLLDLRPDTLDDDKQLTELFVALRDDVTTKSSAFAYVFCDWVMLGPLSEIAASTGWSVSPVPLLVQFASPLPAVRLLVTDGAGVHVVVRQLVFSFLTGGGNDRTRDRMPTGPLPAACRHSCCARARRPVSKVRVPLTSPVSATGSTRWWRWSRSKSTVTCRWTHSRNSFCGRLSSVRGYVVVQGACPSEL